MVPPSSPLPSMGPVTRTALNQCLWSEWQADSHHSASPLDLRNKDTEAQRGEEAELQGFLYSFCASGD